ncbi:hypothetical protein BDV95DRAFT_26819 [Massariosphaeria phaeospora]|uniref:Uncharacterized protein n=1 Tax=Massariosphaeria phaeospora TaxID=100035 RepID=A0A7C8M8X4_9PLEO|nr:hypothetical protein BDV95DRAFT_26819 [Massariosphaeria phaeospora]
MAQPSYPVPADMPAFRVMIPKHISDGPLPRDAHRDASHAGWYWVPTPLENFFEAVHTYPWVMAALAAEEKEHGEQPRKMQDQPREQVGTIVHCQLRSPANTLQSEAASRPKARASRHNPAVDETSLEDELAKLDDELASMQLEASEKQKRIFELTHAFRLGTVFAEMDARALDLLRNDLLANGFGIPDMKDEEQWHQEMPYANPQEWYEENLDRALDLFTGQTWTKHSANTEE